ncbi:MAG: hypothetical protein F4Y03_18235 [Alphaproteobacteria bacterium]|nr:hypothetical protein [Alphaproteobacteria bacterium]
MSSLRTLADRTGLPLFTRWDDALEAIRGLVQAAAPAASPMVPAPSARPSWIAGVDVAQFGRRWAVSPLRRLAPIVPGGELRGTTREDWRKLVAECGGEAPALFACAAYYDVSVGLVVDQTTGAFHAAVLVCDTDGSWGIGLVNPDPGNPLAVRGQLETHPARQVATGFVIWRTPA